MNLSSRHLQLLQMMAIDVWLPPSDNNARLPSADLWRNHSEPKSTATDSNESRLVDAVVEQKSSSAQRAKAENQITAEHLADQTSATKMVTVDATQNPSVDHLTQTAAVSVTDPYHLLVIRSEQLLLMTDATQLNSDKAKTFWKNLTQAIEGEVFELQWPLALKLNGMSAIGADALFNGFMMRHEANRQLLSFGSLPKIASHIERKQALPAIDQYVDNVKLKRELWVLLKSFML